MCLDDSQVGPWNPWSFIPPEFNLGAALTRGQVEAGRGGKPAILWENAARSIRSLTYSELDVMTSRLASSLARLGVKRGDRVFLRLPNIPEFYVAALAVAKLGGDQAHGAPLARDTAGYIRALERCNGVIDPVPPSRLLHVRQISTTAIGHACLGDLLV